MPTLSNIIKSAQQNQSTSAAASISKLQLKPANTVRTKTMPVSTIQHHLQATHTDVDNDGTRLQLSAVSARQIMIKKPHKISRNSKP